MTKRLYNQPETLVSLITSMNVICTSAGGGGGTGDPFGIIEDNSGEAV